MCEDQGSSLRSLCRTWAAEPPEPGQQWRLAQSVFIVPLAAQSVMSLSGGGQKAASAHVQGQQLPTSPIMYSGEASVWRDTATMNWNSLAEGGHSDDSWGAGGIRDKALADR